MVAEVCGDIDVGVALCGVVEEGVAGSGAECYFLDGHLGVSGNA